MRLAATVGLPRVTCLFPSGVAGAPTPKGALTRADSALVLRILTAEDRRDSASAALHEGEGNADPRIRLIARRGRLRITDAKFAARDSLPAIAAPPNYPDAAWRTRYRAIGTRPVSCDSIRAALGDNVWAVRLRAADVATPACASDATILSTLQRWASSPPSNAHRRAGEPGWHSSAHALVALARIAPATARPLLSRYTASPVPGLRAYAARAAASLNDTATLRMLAVDANDNVREVAIDSLSRLTGHASDDIYLRALNARGYQVIRGAARALKGSPRSQAVIAAARPALMRLRSDSSETSRDARAALGDRLKEFGDS